MDSERFDALARGLVFGLSRRGAVAGLAALTGISFAPMDEAEAKKKTKMKKKKKKKPTPGQQCLTLKQPCPTGTAEKCCAGLTCGSNECGGGNVCLRNPNGACDDPCDCLGPGSCSERVGNTCQICSGSREGCPSGNDDCCQSASICSNNGCVNDNDGDVCCSITVGTACTGSCQCCASLGCDERAGSTCGFCVRERSAVFSLADQDACTVTGECCRGDYICGDSPGCQGTPAKVCCGPPQASCEDDCDCCGGLSNCARAIALETNACGVSGVCCQRAGGACDDTCDCCAGQICSSGFCELD